MNISKCEYCNRSNYLNDSDSCKGCGAPIELTAVRYSRETLSEVPMLMRPGVNIPINLNNWIEYHRANLSAQVAYQS